VNFSFLVSRTAPKLIMNTLNKSKTQNSYRHLDGWLNVIFLGKLTPITNQLESEKNNLKEIVEEYRVLINISHPSQSQQTRIEEILELAIYDDVLRRKIDHLEENIAREIGIFEENFTNAQNSNHNCLNSKLENKADLSSHANKIVIFPLNPVSQPITKKYVIRPHINILSVILGGLLALFGVYLFNYCNLFGDSYAVRKDTTVNIKLGSSDYTLMDFPKYIIQWGFNFFINQNHVSREEFLTFATSLQNYEQGKRIILLQQASLAEKNQKAAELQQICFENKQKQAEQKQVNAERKKSLEEARQWKDKAQNYRQKATVYLHQAQDFHRIANTLSPQEQHSNLLENAEYSTLGIDKMSCR